jgi:nickel-dependent lactate racemase
MPDETLTLPWGQEALTLALPVQWHLDGVLTPAGTTDNPDAGEEAQRSLREPIGSPALAALAEPGMAVTIVIDDDSRPTPVHQLLPPVLEALEAGGVRRADVTLITALGVHRPMTEDEVTTRTGASALAGLRWVNHDCDDAAQLATLGETSRGTVVQVNRAVTEADLVVSIGCIEPHLIASFGGGYKNLIPGVAGRETVGHNHALNMATGTFNMVGQPIEQNAMRLDLEEGARMIEPPVFLVNAVLDADSAVVRVVAGDPIAAHRQGAALSASIYGVKVGAPADVVIASSHPMDQDLRQGVKALANTIRAVRRGGVQIILLRAEEGLGVFGLAERKLPLGYRGLRFLAPLLVRAIPHLSLGDMPDDQRFYLYFAIQAMRHCRTILYAPTIPADARAGLPFVTFVDDVQEAVALAHRRVPVGKVIAFSHGGSTYPILG